VTDPDGDTTTFGIDCVTFNIDTSSGEITLSKLFLNILAIRSEISVCCCDEINNCSNLGIRRHVERVAILTELWRVVVLSVDGNQNPLIEEGQTKQWPKEKGQMNKQ
jgi:hypothetical protein